MASVRGRRLHLPIFGKFLKKVYGDSKLGYLSNIPFQLPEGFSPCYDAGNSDEAVEIYEGVNPDSIGSYSPILRRGSPPPYCTPNR